MFSSRALAYLLLPPNYGLLESAITLSHRDANSMRRVKATAIADIEALDVPNL